MHHEETVDKARLLVVVGHNATDKGGLRGHEHVDQIVQLISEVGADRLEVGHLGRRLGLDNNALLTAAMAGRRQVLFLLGLTRVVGIALLHQLTAGGLLQQIHHRVIDRVAILV